MPRDNSLEARRLRARAHSMSAAEIDAYRNQVNRFIAEAIARTAVERIGAAVKQADEETRRDAATALQVLVDAYLGLAEEFDDFQSAAMRDALKAKLGKMTKSNRKPDEKRLKDRRDLEQKLEEHFAAEKRKSADRRRGLGLPVKAVAGGEERRLRKKALEAACAELGISDREARRRLAYEPPVAPAPARRRKPLPPGYGLIREDE